MPCGYLSSEVISKEEFSDFVKFALVYEQVLNHPELLPVLSSLSIGDMQLDRNRQVFGFHHIAIFINITPAHFHSLQKPN